MKVIMTILLLPIKCEKLKGLSQDFTFNKLDYIITELHFYYADAIILTSH